MKKLLFTNLLLFVLSLSFAQKNNGDVNSLLSAEDYLNNLFASKGINQTYLKVTKNKSVFYNPQPFNPKEYYKKSIDSNLIVNKIPDYAVLSKSASFGFTTGLLTIQKEQNINYNRYLTVWKSSRDGKWSIALNAVSPQPQPKSDIEKLFLNPENRDYPRIYGPPYIQLREKVIFNTDSIFGNQLLKMGNRVFKNFYASNLRLYFPNQLPIIGINNAISFINQKNKNINSSPEIAHRASSGDLAYTTGKASFGQQNFNYIRIWQKDANANWFIIIDMYL